MSELTARLDLPLGASAPGTARRVVVAVLDGWGFSDETWLDCAALIVSEVVTNAVRHGGGCLAFAIESTGGRVVISASDASSLVPRRRDPDPAGGRGIALIEAFGARWGVDDQDGGKRVWVELPPCPRPGPGAGDRRGVKEAAA
ncbi:ATP-binding protein [Actinoplanes subtropicus]|uniref:ATP-binding protein n=1 Tax=Actinoplanes subtropicus TaxID=543632 RepID=UPI000691CD76|nr:ATP-binding protein [Actinoplanes subtropicus]